jgi:hypothetical protein
MRLDLPALLAFIEDAIHPHHGMSGTFALRAPDSMAAKMGQGSAGIA